MFAGDGTLDATVGATILYRWMRDIRHAVGMSGRAHAKEWKWPSEMRALPPDEDFDPDDLNEEPRFGLPDEEDEPDEEGDFGG